MGQEIQAALQSHPSAEYLGSYREIKKATTAKNFKNCVLIDFSTPEGFIDSIKWCEKNRIPFVSGTTGLTKKHFLLLDRVSKTNQTLWAPNMSVGINLFLKLINSIGPILNNYDVQLEDIHHAKKKDAPSGTAILLQSELKKYKKNQPPQILSSRIGGVVGVHKLWLANEGEVFTIEHSAVNRSIFAKGAVQAALWLSQQKPGRYGMNDVISQ